MDEIGLAGGKKRTNHRRSVTGNTVAVAKKRSSGASPGVPTRSGVNPPRTHPRGGAGEVDGSAPVNSARKETLAGISFLPTKHIP